MKKTIWSSSKNSLLAIILILCVWLLAGCISLPDDPGKFDFATLQGVVFDGSSRGVQGFQIILDNSIKVVSDINGKFTIPTVSQGKHHLVANKPQQEPATLDFLFNNRSQIIYITSMSTRDYLSSAELALRQNDYGKAQEAIAKALALAPDDPVGRYLSALVFMNTRQYDQAFPIVQKLLEEGVREQAVYLLMIDIATADPQYITEVQTRIADDPYISQIPQISRALKRLADDSTKEQ